jgi:hypothetical protein
MLIPSRALTDALNQRTSVLCGLLLQLRWAVGLCAGLTVLAGSYGLAPLRSGVAALFPELAGPLELAVTGLLALLTVAAALLCWGSLAAGVEHWWRWRRPCPAEPGRGTEPCLCAAGSAH